MKFALLTAQLLSATKDSSFLLVPLGNSPTITDGREQKIMQMMKTNTKHKKKSEFDFGRTLRKPQGHCKLETGIHITWDLAMDRMGTE